MGDGGFSNWLLGEMFTKSYDRNRRFLLLNWNSIKLYSSDWLHLPVFLQWTGWIPTSPSQTWSNRLVPKIPVYFPMLLWSPKSLLSSQSDCSIPFPILMIQIPYSTEHPPKVLNILHTTDGIPQSTEYPPHYWLYPPKYWIFSTLLIVSLKVLNILHTTDDIPQSTEYPPHFWWYSPKYWASSTVLHRRCSGCMLLIMSFGLRSTSTRL